MTSDETTHQVSDREQATVQGGVNPIGAVSMTQSASQERIYVLENYLVIFLDVLGQSDKFEQLRLPRTTDEHAAVQEVMRDTVGFVSDLRARFGIQFSAFEAGLLKNQPSVEKFHPTFVGLSDSFVTSVPIRNEDQHLTPNIRMFSALSAACVVMLTSLASNHALRGGVDLDLATEMAPGEVYGTALMRAYRLESIVADYFMSGQGSLGTVSLVWSQASRPGALRQHSACCTFHRSSSQQQNCLFETVALALDLFCQW
jgi:hypothetical protein